MKFAELARSAAPVTALALIPATTAGLAQVEGRAGPEFSKVFAVYQRIKASYVEEVDDQTLIDGMIDGMLAALDPHSAYLDGSDLQRLETMIDGNYSGLGLSVVAEGISDENDALELRQMGCEYVQSFMFGSPMTADAVTRMLKEQFPLTQA